VPLTIDAALTRVEGCNSALNNNRDAAYEIHANASDAYYKIREALSLLSGPTDGPWFLQTLRDLEGRWETITAS